MLKLPRYTVFILESFKPFGKEKFNSLSKLYFSKYLVGGIAGYLITQVIINIGVAIGLIPVFGIPLPFISSGGSSLLAISIAMGLVIHVNNTQTLK